MTHKRTDHAIDITDDIWGGSPETLGWVTQDPFHVLLSPLERLLVWSAKWAESTTLRLSQDDGAVARWGALRSMLPRLRVTIWESELPVDCRLSGSLWSSIQPAEFTVSTSNIEPTLFALFICKISHGEVYVRIAQGGFDVEKLKLQNKGLKGFEETVPVFRSHVMMTAHFLSALVFQIWGFEIKKFQLVEFHWRARIFLKPAVRVRETSWSRS